MADNKQNTPNKPAQGGQQFVFGKENFIMLGAALVILIIGYFLMSGGGSADPNQFAGETLFNTQRLVVAPLVIMAGFVLGMFAILKKPKQ